MDKINKAAERFREVREELGLTQKEVADRLMLKRNTIAKIESGMTTPSARTLSALEGLLTQSRRQAPKEVDSVHEEQAPYDATWPSQFLSRAQVEARLREYLDLAEKVPGGLGYAWGQVCKHLDKESLLLMKSDQLVEEGRRLRDADRAGGERGTSA